MKLVMCMMIAASVAAFADVVSVKDGAVVDGHQGGKIAGVNAVSTVAAGTVTLKSVTKLWGMKNEIVDASTSNFWWTVVYSNGTDVVTNKTLQSPYPLPDARHLISASSNWVVNTVMITNSVPYVAATITNTLANGTCVGGAVTLTPSDTFVNPGDGLFFEGTAKGRVFVFLVR